MTRCSFSELEASRPPFDASVEPYVSKAPDTAFIPGQGPNGLTYAADFDPGHAQWRTVDPNDHERRQVYKLLISGITPRPVALVSTVSPSGSRNLAPMSNFNVVSSNPPTVMISVESGSTKNPSGLKDTNQNIRDTNEFCVSIISETFVEAAHITAVDAPAGVSEWDLSGLTPRTSETVAPPHVAESAYSMECKVMHWYTITGRQGEPSNTVILGEVTRFHVKEFVMDKDDPMRVSAEKLRPIARLGGLSYSRTNQIFDLPTPIWANFENEKATAKTSDGDAATSSR